MIRESTPTVAATPGLRPVLSGERSPAKMRVARRQAGLES